MSDNETLRDTFAAAALTGLIERRPWPVDKNESATICYQFADAMLRERAATNHDAAPAAKAAELARSPGQSPRGTGDTTREPDAWLVLDATLNPFSAHRHKAAAVNDANNVLGLIFPLYRDPPCQVFLQKNLTLTDAEREAVQICVERMQDSAVKSRRDAAATLRALLARLGGAS